MVLQVAPGCAACWAGWNKTRDGLREKRLLQLIFAHRSETSNEIVAATHSISNAVGSAQTPQLVSENPNFLPEAATRRRPQLTTVRAFPAQVESLHEAKAFLSGAK